MREKTKIIRIAFFLLLMSVVPAFGQKALTLKECIDYSGSNNGNLKIANYDREISQKRIIEQTAMYLPQINGSGALDDNLKLATTLLPGEIFGSPTGTYIPITFGQQYTMSAGVQLTQKLYDPSSLLGIKSAKLNKEVSDKNFQKVYEQTIYNISVIYYQTLVVQMQLNTLKSTLKASEQSLKSIELKYSNGMARKIDVDKIRVSYNNTKSQLQQAELSYSQSLNTLKYQMGMPVDSAIVLADTTLGNSYNAFEKSDENTCAIENLVDYQLKKSNLLLMQVDKKKNLAAYQPTLSFYGNYNFNAMRQEFNFFKPDQDWYQSSGIGLKLSVPIFSGFQRNSRLSQSKLNVLRAEESIRLTEQSIKVDVSNYEIKYKNALANIKNEKENLDLAESVYKNTQLEYQQGTGSILDIIQAENSLVVAQNTYYNKLLNLYIARIDQEKAKGTLISFINNQNL